MKDIIKNHVWAPLEMLYLYENQLMRAEIFPHRCGFHVLKVTMELSSFYLSYAYSNQIILSITTIMHLKMIWEPKFVCNGT